MAKKIVGNTFGMVPERLSEASPSRPACAECGLYQNCASPFTTPYVPNNWTGKYLLVTETSHDGDDEARRSGLPLSQRERTELKKILQDVEIERNDLAFVPVLRCRPSLTGSKKAKMHDIRACRPFVLRTIAELNPEVVVACGKTPVKSLLNSGQTVSIMQWRGRPVAIPVAPEVPVLLDHAHVTTEIAGLLVDPHVQNRMREDFHRLTTKELKYPAKSIPNKSKEIGFDTEYTGETIHILGVADSQKAITVTPKHITQLVLLLRDAILVGHNLPVDIEALLRLKPKGLTNAMEQWLQGKRQRDTLLEARLSDENRGKHGYKLESLLLSYYNVKDWKAPTEALGPDSSVWPVHLRNERCRLDAWATLKLHEALKPYVEGPSELSHAIALSLRRMYWAGVYIDSERFTAMKKFVDKECASSLKVVLKFAHKFGLENFRATNDNDVREYVYGNSGVGLDVESTTKGGLPSVSAKVLKEYKDEKAIQALLTFSKFDKLQSTYVDSLATRFIPVKRGPTNCVWMPVSINPLAAKTGRRSSEAPNFQNWPVQIRKIIRSRFKDGLIIDSDYSKLEPILCGYVANEPKLTDYFVKYPNGYIKIGEDFFKKTVEKNTKEYTMMKSCVLALIYKQMKWSLAETLWVQHDVRLANNYDDHVDKAGQLLESFLDMFPGVRRYHKAQEEAVLTSGKVFNALGQCRRLPLPPEPPRSEKGAYRVWMRYKAHVINQAVNMPVQSLASYVTGCGLIDLERALLRQYKLTYVDYQTMLMEKYWPSMPLLCIEVHDDLVLDSPKQCFKKTKEIIHEIMTKPPSLVKVLPDLFDNVTLTVDTNAGPTWGLKS